MTRGGGEQSLKISAPQLLRFGINSVLKILNKRITPSLDGVGQLIIYPPPISFNNLARKKIIKKYKCDMGYVTHDM